MLLYGFAGDLVIGQDEAWTVKELAESGMSVMAAVEGNGRIVLGGNSSALRVAIPTWWVSTDNGQTFTSYTSTNFTPPDYFIEPGIHGLAYGNGVFVAVGLRGEVWTSPDGVDWTAHALSQVTEDAQAADENLLSVQFHNGEFIATGAHMSIYRSPDGVDWERLHGGSIGELLDTLVVDADDWYAGGRTGAFLSPISPERNLDLEFWDELWIQNVAYTDGNWLVCLPLRQLGLSFWPGLDLRDGKYRRNDPNLLH